MGFTNQTPNELNFITPRTKSALDLGRIDGKPIEASFTDGNQSTEAGPTFTTASRKNIGIIKALTSFSSQSASSELC